MTLAQAKAAALAMAKGAVGDYTVADPVAHLNGLAARLIERSEARLGALRPERPLRF
jgi:hypothetical protein